MAISRHTQKDVGNFEPKFIGPFTMRQTVFVGVAAVICYITHAVIGKLGFDLMTQMVIMLVFACPALAIGFFKPYGMKCEDFLVMYWFYHIKAPAIRKYVTVTDVDVLHEAEDKEKKNEPQAKKEKKSAKTATKKQKDSQIKAYL